MKRLIALILALLFAACGDCKNVTDAVCDAYKNGGAIRTSFEHNQTTPQGTAVHGFQSVSDNQLRIIDSGLTGAFNDARISGYSEALNYSRYDIFTAKYCALSPEQQVPSFLVRADDYDGSEFDQYNSEGGRVRDGIGVVFAAEQVISLGSNGSKGEMLVCPQESHLANAVRHGAEHIVIANNDPVYFDLTWYHGNGFYHPLLPKRDALRGTPKPFNGKPFIRVVK